VEVLEAGPGGAEEIDIDEIIRLKLCPILFTAYGLSMYKTDDNIEMKPLSDVFKDIKDDKKRKHTPLRFGSANEGMDYYLDYDSWK
jgi:hypothetical protein